MKDKFIKYAELLKPFENYTDIVLDLRKIFAENNLFHEEGACLEKLFHLTKDYNLLKEIGEIFHDKVRNYDIANAAYQKYLHKMDNEFYTKYATNLQKLGFTKIDDDSDENLPDDIVFLCDIFDLIVYMMLCLHKNSEYDGIIELIPFLQRAKRNVTQYYNPEVKNDNYLKDIENTEQHLSFVLSGTKNRNDINKFATELCSSNEVAHINIIDDLITYNNYNDAIQYYNDIYCETLSKNKQNSISSICWALSDFYRDRYEFYDAVRMQKKALELDLDTEKTNA